MPFRSDSVNGFRAFSDSLELIGNQASMANSTSPGGVECDFNRSIAASIFASISVSVMDGASLETFKRLISGLGDRRRRSQRTRLRKARLESRYRERKLQKRRLSAPHLAVREVMPFLSLGKATAVMHTKHYASPSSYEQFSGGCVEMRVHGDHEVFEQEASLIFLAPVS
jgi:hypothetical protein